MNKITAFIPARGGSKGIPGKNIKGFAGKPLVVHSIEYALNCSQIDEVVVSTDDDKIAKIARKAGAKVVIRPPELSTDSATTESTIHHFVNNFNKKPDILVLLQPTSPFRPKGSLENAITHFTENGFDSLLSITPTHRFFWRVKEDQTTFAEYDYLNRPHRQNMKLEDIRYMENGSLYIFTRKHFDKTGNRLGGKIGFVEWLKEYSIEIDTQLDFDMVEKLFLSNSEK